MPPTFTTPNPTVREGGVRIYPTLARMAGEQARIVQDDEAGVQFVLYLGGEPFSVLVEELAEGVPLFGAEYPLGGGFQDQDSVRKALAWCAMKNAAAAFGRFVYEHGLVCFQVEAWGEVSEQQVRLALGLVASAVHDVADLCARTGALAIRDLTALAELDLADFNPNDID